MKLDFLKWLFQENKNIWFSWLKVKKALSILFILWLGISNTYAQQRIKKGTQKNALLAIWTNTYDIDTTKTPEYKWLKNLKYSYNDAKDIYSLFNIKKKILLRDSLATKINLERFIQSWVENVSENWFFILFASWHWFKEWLLTHDWMILKYENLAEILSSCKWKVIVIIDACHSWWFSEYWDWMLFALSSTSEELSAESIVFEHWVFSYFLLEWSKIEKGESSKDSELIWDYFEGSKNKTILSAYDFNFDQHPIINIPGSMKHLIFKIQ